MLRALCTSIRLQGKEQPTAEYPHAKWLRNHRGGRVMQQARLKESCVLEVHQLSANCAVLSGCKCVCRTLSPDCVWLRCSVCVGVYRVVRGVMHIEHAEGERYKMGSWLDMRVCSRDWIGVVQRVKLQPGSGRLVSEKRE